MILPGKLWQSGEAHRQEDTRDWPKKEVASPFNLSVARRHRLAAGPTSRGIIHTNVENGV